jgi:hypothetical protein
MARRQRRPNGEGPEPPREALAGLPDDDRGILDLARDLVGICSQNNGARLSYYQGIATAVEAGNSTGQRSLANLLFAILDRRAAMLYSPTDVRFSLDFENDYNKEVQSRATVAARLVGRSWEQTDTDIQFSQGVFESLKYGLAIMKQWPQASGPDRLPMYNSDLIMPWQFGVYRPDVCNLDDQPAMVQTSVITLPEVWRRIWHMPDAIKLFDRIKTSSAMSGETQLTGSNHPVLLASQIQFSQPARPMPGGVVSLSNNGMQGGNTARIDAQTVNFHEIWVWTRDDYATIQFIEPDILIAPRFRVANLLAEGLHPFSLIQANPTHGNIWGRSEIADVIGLQDFLSTTMEDIRRLFGVQVDKILAFTGDDINDEKYGQFKGAGYINIGQGGSVTDLTPPFPQQALPLVDKIIQMADLITGFDNMLSGKGEPGVRSGVQANPMMKIAGARLKDDSLIIERNCAKAADLRLSLMEAKDGRHFWTDPNKTDETRFLLSDIPADRRVVVDGHTTSPVFADEHQSLLTAGLRLGVVDPETYIEEMPFQRKQILIQRLREKQQAQAAQLEELRRTDPEGFAKAQEKALAKGGKK